MRDYLDAAKTQQWDNGLLLQHIAFYGGRFPRDEYTLAYGATPLARIEHWHGGHREEWRYELPDSDADYNWCASALDAVRAVLGLRVRDALDRACDAYRAALAADTSDEDSVNGEVWRSRAHYRAMRRLQHDLGAPSAEEDDDPF